MEYIKNEKDTQEVKDFKELVRTLRGDIRNTNAEKYELNFKIKMLEQALNNSIEQLKQIKDSKEVINCESCVNKNNIIINTNKELEESKQLNKELLILNKTINKQLDDYKVEVDSKVKIIKSLMEDNAAYKERLSKCGDTNKLYSEKLGYRTKKIFDIKNRLENLLKLIELNEEPESIDLLV